MPDDDLNFNEIDFDEEMRQLAGTDMQQLAKQAAGGNTKPKHPLDKSDVKLALGEIVLPLAQEVESIKKAAAENNLLLVALGKKINNQSAVSAEQASQTTALETMAQQMQRLGSVESANQKLFDALHAELKGYKDNFLFEALQKPFIRELLPLFDDLSNLHGQLEKRLEELRARDKQDAAPTPPQPRKTRLIDLPGALLSRNDSPPEAAAQKPKDTGETDFLRNLAGNVEVHVHHMVEILLRMDVALTQTSRGFPLDKKVHRTLSFEAAPTPEDDNTVARSLKPGFFWKERLLRAEDVIIYRWHKPSEPAQAPPTPPAVTDPAPAPDSAPSI